MQDEMTRYTIRYFSAWATLLGLLLLSSVVRAQEFTDCVIYDLSYPPSREIFTAESKTGIVFTDLKAIGLDDWEPKYCLRWADDTCVELTSIPGQFAAVCINAQDYVMPEPEGCTYFDDPEAGPTRTCIYKAELEHNLGYWDEHGTWVAYKHPCDSWIAQMRAGEAVQSEPSCEARYWGLE